MILCVFIWYCIGGQFRENSIGFVSHHTFSLHQHVMLTFNVGGAFLYTYIQFLSSFNFFFLFMTKKMAILWEKLLVLTLLVPSLLLVPLHLYFSTTDFILFCFSQFFFLGNITNFFTTKNSNTHIKLILDILHI